MSKFILGTVQFGLDYGVNNKKGKLSEESAFEILATAKEMGVSILDTAEVYGSSHNVIGKFHKRFPKFKFSISTKLPKDLDNMDVSNIIDKYCIELDVDHIDYILFHSFESYFKNKKITSELEGLKKQNIIRKIGVSVYTNEEALICIDDEFVDIIQIPFNLLDNAFLRGPILTKAKEKNKIIHTRSAFLQGLFFVSKDSTHPAFMKLKPYVTKLENICQNMEISMHDLALAYCFSNPQIDNILIGVDSVEQLMKNLNSLNIDLSKSIISEIENIKVKDVEFLNPSKW